MKRFSADSNRLSMIGLNEGWEDNYRFTVFEPSDNITALNMQEFETFLKNKDVALVMFYDRYVDATITAKENIVKAAKITKRPLSAFASVNCQTERELCDVQGVDSLPSFKLYTRGNLVSTIREYSTFNADTMRKYIEMCPILEQALPPRRLCERSEADPHPKSTVSNANRKKPIWPKEKKRFSCLGSRF